MYIHDDGHAPNNPLRGAPCFDDTWSSDMWRFDRALLRDIAWLAWIGRRRPATNLDNAAIWRPETALAVKRGGSDLVPTRTRRPALITEKPPPPWPVHNLSAVESQDSV